MHRSSNRSLNTMDVIQIKRKKSKKSRKTKTDENLDIQYDHCNKLAVETFKDIAVPALPEVAVDCKRNARTVKYRKFQQVSKQAGDANIYYTHETASSQRLVSNSALPLKFRSMIYRRTENEEDHFIKLSDEIILHIFSWLPRSVLSRCSLVCKRWKAVSYDESLWKKIDLGKKCLKSDVLKNVIGKGVMALRLSLAYERVSTTEDINLNCNLESCDRFCKLQYLDLSMAVFSQTTLNHLFSGCSQLKNVSLEACTINNKICFHLSANPNLQVLNLSMCGGLHSEGLLAIMTNCLQLNSLNIGWTDLSPRGMNVLSKNIPVTVKELNISGYRQILQDQHVTDICNRCPNLVKLDVSDSPQLTLSSLEAIQMLTRLRCLHLSRCYNISPTSYLSLTSLGELQNLAIHGLLSDKVLPAIQHHLEPIEINQELFSTIARPTVDIRRTSIWGIRVHD